MNRLSAAVLIAMSVWGAAGCSVGSPAALSFDSFRPVTPEGAAISGLFVAVMGLSAAVLLIVVVPLLYVIVRFRARDGDADPPQVEGNRTLEVTWTGAALALVTVLFFLGVGTMRAVGTADPSAIRVKVVGHQWWWEIQYPDLGVVTANELRLPVDQAAVLEISSVDVIHSFWVPRLGWKQDAIPGRSIPMWVTVTEPGSQVGVCTEYCGLQHAWMRIALVAEPKEQFDAWVRRERQGALSPAPAAARGMAVFQERTCVNCHVIRGLPAGNEIGPDLTHVGSRSTIGAGVLDMTQENLRKWIRDPQAIKPGVLMPSFADLGEADLAALTAYLGGLK